MAITQVSNSLVKQDLTISGGTVDNTVIGSGTPAAGTFTTVAGTLASTVTGTTQAASDNSTKIATTAYVTTALANLVDSAPGTLNTLNELAAALGDDASFSTTVTNSIATKLPLAGGTMTGNIAHASDFTLDVGGDLIFDADGADFKFRDGGAGFFTISNSSLDAVLKVEQSNEDFIIKGNDGGSEITALTLDMSEGGNATFAGTGTFAGGSANNNDDANILTLNASEHARLLVDTSSTSGHRATLALESNGNETTLGTTGSASFLNVDTGDLTIDVAGELVIDTDLQGSGNGILLKDDGTLYGSIYRSSSHLHIKAEAQDKHIRFMGNDGGSEITALSLEMDAAGKAVFSGRVQPNEHIIFGNTTGYLQFAAASSRAWVIASQGGTAAPGTSSATFGFHHWSGSAWSNPVNISASGKLGVGTDNPLGHLHVKDGSSGMGSVNANFDKLVLEDSSHSGLTILGGANTHGAIYFGDPDVNDVGQIKYKHNDNSLCLTTNSQERWKIDSGGSIRQGGSINFMNSALTLSKFWVAKSRDILGGTDDHAVYYTESGIHHQFWVGGARRVNIINNGITFGTDTAQANTLDDYEEGTFATQFTPSSGSISLNASYDELAYTKIGNVVTVTGYIKVSSVSAPSGILYIGLPFTAASTAKYSAAALCVFNVTGSGTTSDAWSIIDNNSNTIQVYNGSSSSVAANWANRIVTNTDVRIQATYITA